MATFRADGHIVPITLNMSADGFATVSEQLLCLRFHFQLSSIFIEQDVFDVEGVLSETVFQMPIRENERTSWKVGPGQYRVFGVCEPLFSPTSFLTPATQTSVKVLIPPLLQVKIEPVDKVITLLSDSSDTDADDFVFSTTSIQKDVTFTDSSLGLQSQVPRPSCSSQPPLHPDFFEIPSILDLLKTLAHTPGCKNEIRSLDFSTLHVRRVKYLPPIFNGFVMFELPPLSPTADVKIGRLLDGMDKKYDGHVWCKTKTTNIKNDVGLTFRRAVCVGHIQCQNDLCSFFTRSSKHNDTEWDGFALNPFAIGQTTSAPSSSTLVCKICKLPPTCINTCPCRMYYVLSKGQTMTRACIHFGSHEHPVSDGMCRETIDKIHALIGEEVSKTPNAKNSAIALAASKEFLSTFLLQDDHHAPTPLKGHDLNVVMEKFKTLSSPNVRSVISSFRLHSQSTGYIDKILELKKTSRYDYVQESVFPGQGSNKVFLFKMSIEGPGSGFDLVKRMQPGGDLENAWIMFDHVKRVKDWTTMACHVYDTTYCKVMTIVVCDMQSEDTQSQCLLWNALNRVMAKHGVPATNFKGFMADNAQANWNDVRQVYGTGDPKVPLQNRERTCLFHWTKSLEAHTIKLIKPTMQHQHKILCKQYKDAKTEEESERMYLAIRAWWFSSGAATEEQIQELNDWLGFWHFRYRQWGGFMQLVIIFSFSLSN